VRRPFLALALAAATVVVAALASVSAHATAPGGNGLIAFHRLYGRAGVTAGIFAMNPHGSGVSQLTHPAFRPQDDSPDFPPDFSPDGKLILFRSEGKHGEGGNYYTVRPNGSGLTQLTHFSSKASVASARFSPDGQSIVFGYDANGGNADIYTMKLDGTGLTQ